MATFTKAHLSHVEDGLGVAVGTTSTNVHTSVSGQTAGSFSEVFLWATNIATAARVLTIEFGTTTAADGNIIVTVPPKQGLMAVLPGLILHNAKVVTAKQDGTAGDIMLYGYVNEIA